MRKQPQTADEARECIAEIRRVNKPRRAAEMIAQFVRRDCDGICNWSDEARAVWQSAVDA